MCVCINQPQPASLSALQSHRNCFISDKLQSLPHCLRPKCNPGDRYGTDTAQRKAFQSRFIRRQRRLSTLLFSYCSEEELSGRRMMKCIILVVVFGPDWGEAASSCHNQSRLTRENVFKGGTGQAAIKGGGNHIKHFYSRRFGLTTHDFWEDSHQGR